MMETYFLNLGFKASESKQIAASFQETSMLKGGYFAEEGKLALKLAYVEEGLFQYFARSVDTDERTTYIAMKGSFIASLLSYLTEKPARETIKALSNAKLWIINKSQVLHLQQEIPAFKDFYLQLIETQLCCIDHSKFDFITLTAEQRYEKLLKEEPDLIREVPLHYLASMLGITARHLSRIRRK